MRLRAGGARAGRRARRGPAGRARRSALALARRHEAARRASRLRERGAEPGGLLSLRDLLARVAGPLATRSRRRSPRASWICRRRTSSRRSEEERHERRGPERMPSRVDERRCRARGGAARRSAGQARRGGRIRRSRALVGAPDRAAPRRARRLRGDPRRDGRASRRARAFRPSGRRAAKLSCARRSAPQRRRASRASRWSAAHGTRRRSSADRARRATTPCSRACRRRKWRRPGSRGPTRASPTGAATARASRRPAGTRTSGSRPTALRLRWLARIARLLREADIDASSASVIETVRLADALAAMRGLSMPGLVELSDATQSVLCGGDATPIALIRTEAGDRRRARRSPRGDAAVPLQRDLTAAQKRLRLKPSAEQKPLELDLRSDNDRARSQLLHRLNSSNSLGQGRTCERQQAGHLSRALDARVAPRARRVARRGQCLREHARVGGDCEGGERRAAMPISRSSPRCSTPRSSPSCRRRSTASSPGPGAGRALRRRAAPDGGATAARPHDPLRKRARDPRRPPRGHHRRPVRTHRGRSRRRRARRSTTPRPRRCSTRSSACTRASRCSIAPSSATSGRRPSAPSSHVNATHGLVRGGVCRLLVEQQTLRQDELERLARIALSPATAPAQAAAWVEGLLRGSALLLLHHDGVWSALDHWLTSLGAEASWRCCRSSGGRSLASARPSDGRWATR